MRARVPFALFRRCRAGCRVRRPAITSRSFHAKLAASRRPGAHALPKERRHLVRCIAGEQQPLAPPLRRKRGMESINDSAFDRGFGRVDIPRLQQLVHALALVIVAGSSPRHQHEFPAMALAGHGHESRRPRRIAILDCVDDPAGFVGGFRHAVGRLLQDHVEDDPALMRAQVLQLGAHEAPHRRAGAVTADRRSARSSRTASPDLRSS